MRHMTTYFPKCNTRQCATYRLNRGVFHPEAEPEFEVFSILSLKTEGSHKSLHLRRSLASGLSGSIRHNYRSYSCQESGAASPPDSEHFTHTEVSC